MAGTSSDIKKELDNFTLSSRKIGEKISGIGEIWRDSNYASLQSQIGELAKESRKVIETGSDACASIDKFDAIAMESVN